MLSLSLPYTSLNAIWSSGPSPSYPSYGTPWAVPACCATHMLCLLLVLYQLCSLQHLASFLTCQTPLSVSPLCFCLTQYIRISTPQRKGLGLSPSLLFLSTACYTVGTQYLLHEKIFKNTVKSRQGLGPIQISLLFCGDGSRDEEKGISQTYLGSSPNV